MTITNLQRRLLLAMAALFISAFSLQAQWIHNAGPNYLTTLNDRVGIGTSSPFSPLHVKFTSNFPAAVPAASVITLEAIKVGAAAGTGRYQLTTNSNGSFYLRDALSLQNRLYVKPDGNVGIGTDNPGAKLTVMSGSQPLTSRMQAPASSYSYNTILLTEGGQWETNKVLAVRSASTVGGQAQDQFVVFGDGKVHVSGGLNIDDPFCSPSYRLSVNGKARFKQAEVTANGWCDYVFEEDYELRNLKDLEKFIDENHHLPEIPTTEQVEADGINIADMDARLLKKIEELTLYVIELNKEIEQLKANEH